MPLCSPPGGVVTLISQEALLSRVCPRRLWVPLRNYFPLSWRTRFNTPSLLFLPPFLPSELPWCRAFPVNSSLPGACSGAVCTTTLQAPESFILLPEPAEPCKMHSDIPWVCTLLTKQHLNCGEEEDYPFPLTDGTTKAGHKAIIMKHTHPGIWLSLLVTADNK